MPRSSILAAGAALLLSACARETQSSAPPDGAALFREQNCVQCHAQDGSGTNLGPTLHGKKQYWTRERIAAYLSDPQAVVKADARLSQLAGNYMLPMTKFPLSLEQRLALADHVLALP